MNGCAEFQKSRFAWLIVRLKNNTTALEVTRQELAFTYNRYGISAHP